MAASIWIPIRSNKESLQAPWPGQLSLCVARWCQEDSDKITWASLVSDLKWIIQDWLEMQRVVEATLAEMGFGREAFPTPSEQRKAIVEVAKSAKRLRPPGHTQFSMLEVTCFIWGAVDSREWQSSSPKYWKVRPIWSQEFMLLGNKGLLNLSRIN